MGRKNSRQEPKCLEGYEDLLDGEQKSRLALLPRGGNLEKIPIREISIKKPDGIYPEDIKDPREIFSRNAPYIAARMSQIFIDMLDSGEKTDIEKALILFAPWRRHIFKEMPTESITVSANLGRVDGSRLGDLQQRVLEVRSALSRLPNTGTDGVPNSGSVQKGSSGDDLLRVFRPSLENKREISSLSRGVNNGRAGTGEREEPPRMAD